MGLAIFEDEDGVVGVLRLSVSLWPVMPAFYIYILMAAILFDPVGLERIAVHW